MKRRIPQQKKPSLVPIVLVGLFVVLALSFMIYRGIRKETGNPILMSASDVPRITASGVFATVSAMMSLFLRTSARLRRPRTRGAGPGETGAVQPQWDSDRAPA